MNQYIGQCRLKRLISTSCFLAHKVSRLSSNSRTQDSHKELLLFVIIAK